MPYGLYISAAGADAQARRLEVISNNLANVDTPGFKREVAILQARHSEAIEQNLDQPGSLSINDIGGGMRLQETLTDFSASKLRPTGRDTDLAIESDNAFFLVDKDGQQLLTRAGDFHFSADGRLITQQGYSVLGSGGDPIAIDPTQPFEITPGGRIKQQGLNLDLALVEPASRGDLARVGNNLFRPLAPTRPLLANTERPKVLSGFLEQSGVSPTTEMMSMIEASRAYEANVKMIQNQDQVIGALLNRVLRQS